MKHLLLIASLTLSGCATLGDIEGTGRVGEVIRSINKTDSVLTGRSHSSYNGAKFNRMVGHTKALRQKGGYSIPVIVRDAQDIYRYTK